MKMKILASACTAALVAGMAQAGSIDIVNPFGMPGLTGSVDVVEYMSGSTNGHYTVSNNTNGSLIGFGVSNNNTSAVTYGGNCSTNGGTIQQICYRTRTLTSANWGTETVFLEATFQDLTFQQIFGDFSDAAGGDNTINWFDAEDGDLQAGATSANFFGFLGLNTASNIIGIGSNQGGQASFTAGAAVAPGPTAPAVPLPAAGWMLIAGLGGLAAAGKRRKA